MFERCFHESVYRGSKAMKDLQSTTVALCGTGAVGSNLAMNLARQGFSSLLLIDRDRVEPRNLGTQVWSEAEVGLLKAECLRNRLFDELGLEAEARAKELTDKNARKLLRGASILIDSFDNTQSRAITWKYASKDGIPCLHVGLNGDYAEVIWNEYYRVPSGGGEDVCDYPLARNLILLAVAVASESLIRYIIRGAQENYTITLGDFAIRRFEQQEP